MKLYFYIFMFWIVIGIILSINFPDVTNVIRMPKKLGGFSEVQTSIYTFPIYFSVYMTCVVLSIIALFYTFGTLKFFGKNRGPLP